MPFFIVIPFVKIIKTKTFFYNMLFSACIIINKSNIAEVIEIFQKKKKKEEENEHFFLFSYVQSTA